MSVAESRARVYTALSACLAVLLVLSVVSACATPASTDVASVPTSAAVHTPTVAAAAGPTATTEPTETPETPTSPAATVAPSVTPPATARYRLDFEAVWSRETNPTDFPPNPHFSGLIGATHSPTAHLWAEGEAASAGIQSMAETGRKSPLDDDIGSLIANGAPAGRSRVGGSIHHLAL